MAKKTVISWNVERLFHPGGSALSRSLDATSAQGWTRASYLDKVDIIGAVLRNICGAEPPALLALTEVENAAVVNDILEASGWPNMVDAQVKNEQLAGYDVAIAYSADVFDLAGEPVSHNIHNRYSTRDILQAPLVTHGGDPITVINNHWPSRKISLSAPLRIGASDYCSRIIERLLKFPKEDLITNTGQASLPARSHLEKRWNTPVLVLGDFNDNPFDDSATHLGSSIRDCTDVTRAPRLPKDRGDSGVASYLRMQPRLYNPTWQLLNKQSSSAPGSYQYNGEWHLLDQMLFSRGLLLGDGITYVEGSLHVQPAFHLQRSGGRKVQIRSRGGAPLSFDAARLRGVSDHLPMICELDIPI